MMFMGFFHIFFIKSYVVSTHLNCIDKSSQLKWVPVYSICLYKEVDKKYVTRFNLTTGTELIDCALVGVCVVIRSNTVLPFLLC